MADVSKTPWIVPGKWSTSMYNWEQEVRSKWTLPSKITIHDVTLRDGEQTPGVVFRLDEKLKIAHALADAGVQRIEGGMAAVSPEDAEAISRMAKEIKTAEIASFCRVRKGDVDLGLKCNVGRLIIELAARDQQINSIFGSREKAAEELINVIKYAKSNGVKVTLFLMESSRADVELLKTLIIPTVKEANPDSVALVDTRGVALPEAMVFMVKMVRKWVSIPIEVHCHNVWGLAAANTLAAVTAGAEIVHTCLNGLGGNAPLDEIVLGLESLIGIKTGFDTKKLLDLANMTREFARANWYKPFVGDDVSYVEAGIPVKTMWDNRKVPGMGRDFINYEVVGGRCATVVLGKKSGRFSMMLKAEELNLPLPSEEQANKMLTLVKDLSTEKKGLVDDGEFKEIYNKVMKG